MLGAHVSDQGYDLGQILDTPMIANLELSKASKQYHCIAQAHRAQERDANR